MLLSASTRVMIAKIFAIVALLSWYSFWLATPVVFTTGDLGRHLKNGEIVVSAIRHHQPLTTFFHTNFYSATYADFPFINHHWGTGVIFYGIWSLGGFKGLSIAYAILSIGTFLIFLRLAIERAGWLVTSPLAFFLIPLIAERVELRPEGFSYFFAGLFLLLLTFYHQGKIKWKTLLIALPILNIVWVNCHIYFVFGLAIIGLFGLEEFFTKSDKLNTSKKFALLFFLTTAAGALNPSGVAGLLYPLQIFQNYGIGVSENQPGWVLVQQGFKIANYPVFKIALAFLIIGLVLVAIKKRKNLPLATLGLAVIFGTLSWTAVRNYTMFGLFALPALAALVPRLIVKKWIAILIVGAMIVSTLAINHTRISDHSKEYGIGILPTSLNSANFFKENNLQGPIFNDFDIGGYLIYTLFPQVRPFVDNRPEAYPTSAFQDVFLPMQVSPDLWLKHEEKFGFNAIIFSLDDRAPWTLPFIVARLTDPTWAPVFADKSVIIFLKRNKTNEAVIKKFEIPNDRFGLRTVE